MGEIKGKGREGREREMGVEPHHSIYLIKIINISISLKYKIGSNVLLLPKYSLYFTKSVYDNQWVLLSQVVIDDGIQFYTTVLINVY